VDVISVDFFSNRVDDFSVDIFSVDLFSEYEIHVYLTLPLCMSLNIHLLGASRRPIWSDMIPIDISEQWRED